MNQVHTEDENIVQPNEAKPMGFTRTYLAGPSRLLDWDWTTVICQAVPASQLLAAKGTIVKRTEGHCARQENKNSTAYGDLLQRMGLRLQL